MARPHSSQRGAIFRTFGFILLGLALVASLCAVLYLMSEINRGRYRLRVSDSTLIVQRGAYLPFGFVNYEPAAEDLVRCYAPIPIPAGQAVDTAEIFGDRTDLDRALFAILAGWARTLITSSESDLFKLGVTLVERAELLPGLSEEQRVELRSLRADTSFARGHIMLESVVFKLKEARSAFQESLELGTKDVGRAREWIEAIDRKLKEFGPNGQERNPTVAPDDSTLAPSPLKPPADKPSVPEDHPNWRL